MLAYGELLTCQHTSMVPLNFDNIKQLPRRKTRVSAAVPHTRFSGLGCFIVLSFLVTTATATKIYNPLIVVPGFFGSNITVTVAGQTEAPDCPSSGTFTFGFPTQPTGDFSEECMLKLLKLHVDPKIGKFGEYSNLPGISVTIPHNGFSRCTAALYALVKLFDPFYEAGYVEGRDLFTFCYDWRLAPDLAVKGASNQDSAIAQLTAMVRRVHRATGDRVFLLGHSYGCSVALGAINHMTPQERKEMIGGYIAVAPILSGGLISIGSILRGLSITGSMAQVPSVSTTFESWPSLYSMLPADPPYNMPLVNDSSTNTLYEPADYEDLFRDAGALLAVQLYHRFVARWSPGTVPLLVDTFAFFGTGLEMPLQLEFDGVAHGDNRVAETVDGDLLVDVISADHMAAMWGSEDRKFKFEIQRVEADHNGILHVTAPAVLDILLQGGRAAETHVEL